MVEWQTKLKRIVKKLVVTVRTGFVWLWLSISDNNGEHNNETSRSIKCLLFLGGCNFGHHILVGEIFSVVQNRPDRFWGTPSFLFRVYWGSFPEINLTNHLYLMPSCTFFPAIHFHVLDGDNFTLLHSALFYGSTWWRRGVWGGVVVKALRY